MIFTKNNYKYSTFVRFLYASFAVLCFLISVFKSFLYNFEMNSIFILVLVNLSVKNRSWCINW